MEWKADAKQASASDPKSQDPAGSSRHLLQPGRAGGGSYRAAILPEPTGVTHCIKTSPTPGTKGSPSALSPVVVAQSPTVAASLRCTLPEPHLELSWAAGSLRGSE